MWTRLYRCCITRCIYGAHFWNLKAGVDLPYLQLYGATLDMIFLCSDMLLIYECREVKRGLQTRVALFSIYHRLQQNLNLNTQASLAGLVPPQSMQLV